MINDISELLGVKNEVEKEYKKMLDFPRTLFVISLISALVFLINKLSGFIKFNSNLEFFYLMLIGILFIVSIFLYVKTNFDLKKANKDFNEQFWNKYRELFDVIDETGKIDDISVNMEENKLSRLLNIQCKDQEVTPNIIDEFLNKVLNNKTDEVDLKKFPMENWDFYQIYGLRMAYLSTNKATLVMKYKLPDPAEQTVKNIEIISMYLNAFSTLKKQKQILYKKDKEQKVDRKIINV